MDTPNDTEKSTEREEVLVDNSSANITDGKKNVARFPGPNVGPCWLPWRSFLV